MHKRSQTFLGEVKDQIKSKEAKDFVAVELYHHLKEAKNKWMEKGLDEAAAEEKAVVQMGNPITLGQELNKLHRPKMDWLIVILLGTAMGLGFLPILFIKSDFYSAVGLDPSYFTIRKAILFLVGGGVAISLMLIDYRKLKKYGMWFYATGILVLVLFVDSFIYIQIGPLKVEPLIAIPLFLLAWATFFNQRKIPLWQLGLLFLLSLYLFFMVANTPTIFIYVVVVFVMFWMSRFSRKIKWGITMGIAGSILLLGLIVWPAMKQYQIVRLLAFIDPVQYAEGEGYMILLLREHISRAGWFGNSLKSGKIPDVHTDYVFAGFTYYFGWLAAFVLIFFLSLFIVRIVMISRNVHEPFGNSLLIGAVALYSVQLISNVCMTLGLVPITSISLPFISYGVMPILLNAFIMGIVLSVYRRKDLTSMRLVES